MPERGGAAGLDPQAVLAAWERGTGQDPARRALTLLTAVRGADTLAGDVRDTAGSDGGDIDVGSRDVLLARVLASVAGTLVWARAGCGACSAELDVPVDVAAFARLPVHRPGTRFTTTVDGVEVAFRLPTTADLLAVRGLDPQRARDVLLARCLLTGTGTAGPDGTGTVEVDTIEPASAEAVEAAMDRVAPAGAAELLVGCPTCGAETPTALDVPLLLWAEIEAHAAALIDDVHTLADAYGWTETQVLALSPARRAAYLKLAGP